MTGPMQATALAYARSGLAVFPVCSPEACAWRDRCPGGRDLGKHPIPKGGLKMATTDLAQITTWWRRDPHANIGIRTGPASGVWVLDIDIDHAGDETLAKLVDANGSFTTLVARTGSGGFHHYFTWPTDGTQIPNSAAVVGMGVDVRGERDGRAGYVVAPPSLHRCGGRYLWVGDERRPRPAPDWLVREATRLIVHSKPKIQRRALPFAPPRRGYWQRAVVLELEQLRQKTAGQCHFELVKSATRLGSLHHLGMTDAEVDSIVEDLADAALENAEEPRNRAKALETARECFENGKAYKRFPKGRAS